MEYVMVEINFTGSDDIFFQGFKIQAVQSVEDYQKQMKEKLTKEVEQYGCIEIFSSNIDSTKFDSVENIWPAIRFQKVTEDEVKVMQKLLRGTDNHIEHGHIPDFFRYDTPKPVVKIKM